MEIIKQSSWNRTSVVSIDTDGLDKASENTGRALDNTVTQTIQYTWKIINYELPSPVSFYFNRMKNCAYFVRVRKMCDLRLENNEEKCWSVLNGTPNMVLFFLGKQRALCPAINFVRQMSNLFLVSIR